MTTSVISAFEDEVAGRVVRELLKAGLPERDVEVLEGDGDELVGEIVGRGFAEEDARGFAGEAAGGKRLVAARVPEDQVERAVAVMERHEAARGEGREGSGGGGTVQ